MMLSLGSYTCTTLGIKKNHDYTILRQVFDKARDGGDDWVEDRIYVL